MTAWLDFFANTFCSRFWLRCFTDELPFGMILEESEGDYLKDLLEHAMITAASAHMGQLDKGGQPYILHPIRVMLQCGSMEERAAALLHDVLVSAFLLNRSSDLAFAGSGGIPAGGFGGGGLPDKGEGRGLCRIY